jgi:hypothetical protein
MLLSSDPRYFDGEIDEVRISTVARSADWITAEYNNQSDPANFHSACTEETAPAPTVTGVAPTSGPDTGGTSVTITGTGFDSGVTNVTFGGTAATGVTFVNATTITATTPAHAAGAVDVVVTNPDTQSGTLTNGYTYNLPAPTVTSVAPNSGPDTGGTSVTITGTNFDSGVTNVTFGGTAATGVTFVNSTSITATTPAHAAGAVDVVVTNPDTQSGTLTTGYTYTGPIAHWTFDEGTGQTAADSIGTNDGTLGTTAGVDANDPTWACVTGGYALDFDGTDDLVDAGSAATLDDLGPMTITGWIKPRDPGVDHVQKIFAKGTSSGSTGRWFLEIDDTDPEIDSLEFLKGGTSNTDRTTSNLAVSWDTWQHIAITWDGSTTAANVHIYKDGTELTYQTTTNGSGCRVIVQWPHRRCPDL